ncbi:MAG: response regulator [Bacillota bacterium]|nr:response regulator [Bacillota bacterium]
MKYKVLVAEDEAIIRKGLIFSVDWQELGCSAVLEAGDGQETIDQIKKACPDIVIIDINMPVVNGLQVLEQTFEEYEYTPIIITGYSDFKYAKDAMKFGVNDYILKPVDFNELNEAVNNAKIERQRRLAFAALKSQELSLKNIDLLNALREDIVEDETVKKMVSFIKKNYAKKITVYDLSEAFNYSETFLIRKFKTEMKINFSEFLNRYRIQKAIWAIKNTDKYLHTIAAECGFKDYKYFNMVFKKYIGCSSREFARVIK